MTSTAETIHQCPHCEAEVDPEELGGRVYECQNDGLFVAEEGEGNRCPECNKFAAKVADQSCPDCGEAIGDGELEEREVYRSEDGTPHDTAEDAEAWDSQDARLTRERLAAASEAQQKAWADERRQAESDRIARLRAALGLPSTPPIGYYRPALANPRGGVWIFQSLTASVTPAEFLAICGASDWGAAEVRCLDLGLLPPDAFMAATSTSFSIDVNYLCTLLEAPANRETN